jgi:hypothetical protein
MKELKELILKSIADIDSAILYKCKYSGGYSTDALKKRRGELVKELLEINKFDY